jgi:hypothetical protein
MGRDRRAPVVARHEIALEPREFRERLAGFENALEGLDLDVRRQVRLLVGHLMAQWLALEGPFRTMVLTVEVLPTSVRVDLAAKPEITRHSFWDSLVTPHVEDLVMAWGIDRRRSSGAWFEIELD